MNQTKLIILIVGLAGAVSAGVYIGMDELKAFTVQQRMDDYSAKLNYLDELEAEYSDEVYQYLKNIAGAQTRIVCEGKSTLEEQVICIGDSGLNERLSWIEADYTKTQQEIQAMTSGQ